MFILAGLKLLVFKSIFLSQKLIVHPTLSQFWLSGALFWSIMSICHCCQKTVMKWPTEGSPLEGRESSGCCPILPSPPPISLPSPLSLFPPYLSSLPHSFLPALPPSLNLLILHNVGMWQSASTRCAFGHGVGDTAHAAMLLCCFICSLFNEKQEIIPNNLMQNFEGDWKISTPIFLIREKCFIHMQKVF